MRNARRLASLTAAFAAALGATVATAAGTVVKHNSEVVALYAGRVTTVSVPYPDALEFAGARYSGAVRILGASRYVGGRHPSLRRIHVLSAESTQGGSAFRVRIRNTNPHGTLAGRAVITVTTEEPSQA